MLFSASEIGLDQLAAGLGQTLVKALRRVAGGASLAGALISLSASVVVLVSVVLVVECTLVNV